jgi:predicted ribosomally synthesized peptide with SipW-like signal peptide
VTTRVRVLAAAIAVLVLSCGVGVTYAAFSDTASNAGNSFSAKRIFPGARALSARDVRDASSGSESNASDAHSFADGVVYQTDTGIGSGTNRYVEYTMNSARPAGISVSSAQFSYRLASKGGPGSGNACFWFDVRSGGNVIGTHGSYAAAVGCSTGNTQATFSTALPEVTSTDQVNGLVVRVYVWETASKAVNVDMAKVTGATPYTPSFTAYQQQFSDGTSGTPVTTVWPLTAADSTVFTNGSNWPSAAPAGTKYLKFTYDPSIPAGATLTGVTLTNRWAPSASVTNGGTLCYYVEALNGTTSLATHGSAASPVSCRDVNTSVTDSVSLPEVDDATKANNLVIKLYYWISPQCGGPGKPNCVKTATDQAQVTFDYYLD